MPTRNNQRTVETLTWPEIRDEVYTVDKELARIIDDCDPGNQYKLLKVRYLYGDLVIDKGVTQLPTKSGELRPINNPEIDEHLRKALNYQSIPLFLTLENDNEVFISTKSRAIPLNLFHQGSLLGLFEAFDYMAKRSSLAIWSVSAGSRSIAMLPKITDIRGLKKLNSEYNIPSELDLKKFSNHWHLFRLIAQHPNFEQKWFNTVLFFTEEWITSLEKSPSWLKLKAYLFQKVWLIVQSRINKVTLSLIWEQFSEAISQRNLKPIPYIIDHAKHILAIATAQFPGFRVTNNTQHAAPTRGIKDVFYHVYALKQHLSSMINIYPLEDLLEGIPMYYSLSFPTLLDGSPIKKHSSTIMLDLRNIKLLLDTFLIYLNRQQLTENMMHNAHFNYYNIRQDGYDEIKPSTAILAEDPEILRIIDKHPDRSFCESSTFWCGCVGIKVDKST